MTPVLVAVSRTNNFDTMVVMFLLFATWAVLVAAERGSLKLLLLSVALVGLGFNIKMLQAYMVLPAIYFVYLLSPAGRIRKKLSHLLVATAVLLVISLTWAVIVDLTPADQRPYVGSSQTNSVIELALGYNGIQRVVPGGSPIGSGMPFGSNNVSPAGTIGTFSPPGTTFNRTSGAGMPGEMPLSAGDGAPGGMGGPGGEGGAAGIFRMFNVQMAGQISWLLPLAILGFFTALAMLLKSGDEGTGDKMRSLLFWGMWMLPMLAYFSIAGFFHRYYLVMLAPSIAALCGIGLTEMWKACKGKGLRSMILPLSLVVTALIQAYIALNYPEWRTWLVPIICSVSITSAVVLAFAKLDTTALFKGIVRPLAICACTVLLIAPALWSLTPIIYHTETMIPYAGPELNTGMFRMSINMSMPGTGAGMPPMGGGMGEMISPGLTQYLIDHMQNETYLVAVPNANMAAGIILETGRPVMAIGGFLGSDPILTVDRLKKMVADGEVRYFMTMGEPDFASALATDGASNSSDNGTSNMSSPVGTNEVFSGGMPGMMGGQSEITSWVKAHGTLVPASEYTSENVEDSGNAMGIARGFTSSGLYDLRGGM
jgi:4-amino-4-deoxy-L-arabinose transferase-like glycosyltransferase